MELKELIQDLSIVVEDEVCDRVRNDYSHGTAKWYVDDGYFIIECYDVSDSVSVKCFDNDNKQKNCPLLCEFITKELNKRGFWAEAREEFRDDEPETEPGLDPGFSSWQDFYDYMYH